MVFEAVIYFAVGVILIVLGLLTWKKQKISLLHGYHYQNVQEKDIPAYTRLMGIGQIVIGIGLCLTGILRLLSDSYFSWSPLIAGLVIGIVIMHRGQMKYNRSWFS